VGDEVEDVVKQVLGLKALAGVVVDVGEGQGRVHPPAPQRVEGLGRLGVDELDLQARVLPADDVEHPDVGQLGNQAVGSPVRDAEGGLDLAHREARIRDREVDEVKSVRGPQAGGAHRLLEALVRRGQSAHLGARAGGRRG